MIIFVISLNIVMVCKHSSRNISNNREKTDKSSKSIYIEPLNIHTIDQTNVDLEKITYLQKIGEITEGFSKEEENYFAKITDLCIDKKDNLYIADSKLHKIFKFNKDHEFLISFGQEGQGPGEFTGRLRISAGNDGNLYVSDHGNKRFCIFSSNGKFIRQFPLPINTHDFAVANSLGEIYLLSESGLKVIDCFNSSYKYFQSLLELKYNLDFPLEQPSKAKFKRYLMRPPLSIEVHKILTKDDHLFLVFNNSLIIVCFDQNNKLVNQFRIDHPRFIKDLRKRLRMAKKKGAWIVSFGSAFLDNEGHICLCYYNSNLSAPELYRYQENGKFVDTLIINDLKVNSNRIIKVCDSIGNFYGIDSEFFQVFIYRLTNK